MAKKQLTSRAGPAEHPLSESLEMYLKTIYQIEQKKKAARVTDIAHELGVINSSVTGALRTLSNRGLINYAPYDIVTLTDDGEQLARDILEKYTTLRQFFIKVLGMDEQTAEADACQMEHRVSATLFNRLSRFVQYYESCPFEKVRWNEAIGYFCTRNQDGCDLCEEDRDSLPSQRDSGQAAPPSS